MLIGESSLFASFFSSDFVLSEMIVHVSVFVEFGVGFEVLVDFGDEAGYAFLGGDHGFEDGCATYYEYFADVRLPKTMVQIIPHIIQTFHCQTILPLFIVYQPIEFLKARRS